jgi:hypothetical protein
MEEQEGFAYNSILPSFTSSSLPIFAYSAGNESVALNEGAQFNTYAYAPSIMKVGNEYYMWACSGVSGTGDSVVFTSSTDGVHWTDQTFALHAFDALSPDRDGFYSNACDPSVVQFTPVAGGPMYYYMFFSMTYKGISTVNGVARSTSPSGPFSVYIGGDPNAAGNWVAQVDSNHKPYIIQRAASVPCDENTCYGAGQPTVVVKNGTLQMWYTDTTANPFGIYYTTSQDGVSWTTAVPTSMAATSVDVKYDPSSGQYLMLEMGNQMLAGASISLFSSTDGLNWVQRSVYGGTSLPPFSHNPGMLGDASGYFISDHPFIGFGAPYQLNDYSYTNDCSQASNTDLCAGHWNLITTPLLDLFNLPSLQ